MRVGVGREVWLLGYLRALTYATNTNTNTNTYA